MFDPIEKRTRLADPVATTGDRVQIICSQNGLFPDSWDQDHVPHEQWGIWAPPIKLLDGFWLAIHNKATGVTGWLTEADACQVYGPHTEFNYRIGPLQVMRRDFVPDGIVGAIISITVQMPADFTDELELLAFVRSDLRPGWLGEEIGMQDGPDSVEANNQQSQVIFRDVLNPWSVIVGSTTTTRQISLNEDTIPFLTNGDGATALLRFTFHPKRAGVLQSKLIFAGSAHAFDQAKEAYGTLRVESSNLVEAKNVTYLALARTNVLQTTDAQLNLAFQWAKFTTQMLAYQTHRDGPAVAGGLPTYPWWFGIDSEYSVLPMLQVGLFDLTKSTLRLIKAASEERNPDEPGRVIHELSTTGVVFNPGNIMETPVFTRAVYQTWCWTGDHAFLEEFYPFCKQGLLDYTLTRCDADGDLCASGPSIIETLEMHAGFETIDTASYTWEALVCLQKMATALGDTALLTELEAKAAELVERIRTEWWLPAEGLFADVRASVQEVLEKLDAIAQIGAETDESAIRQQVQQAHKLFARQLKNLVDVDQTQDLAWLLRHWIVLCPLEVGLATATQAEESFARLLTPEFCNEWGMYLHPERHDVMSINSGLLALALARYGRIDDALHLVQQMAGLLTARTPGAISEALPDQWCFLQLWSALGIVSPLVEGVLGIEPIAAERKLQVILNWPNDWDHVSLQQMRVGDTRFDITATRTAGQYTVQVLGDATDYQITVGIYLPENIEITSVQLNNQNVRWQWETRLAGNCLVCEAEGAAKLVVIVAE